MVWKKQRILILGLLLFAFSACSRQPKTIVFCAASLSELIPKIAAGEQESDLILHSGGSMTLVSQYLGGAEADLLILADAALSETLGEKRSFQSKVFAGNRLVLACAKERPIAPEALYQESTALALADPQSAPLGRYSEQALAGIPWKARRILLKDATAVLVALKLGHADTAVVYASDLQSWPELIPLSTDLDLSRHDPIRYLAVLPEPASAEATRLYDKLTGEAGQGVFRGAGLVPLNELEENSVTNF